MLVMVIPQTKVVGNDTMEKPRVVKPQPKVVGNNISEESLVDVLVRSQLDCPAKTVTDG